ncbi:MAG: hypothetical protein HQK98_10665 [Nitrospirae bacterium]|nr:hypothetical protein [Nitrospirota bacterium]
MNYKILLLVMAVVLLSGLSGNASATSVPDLAIAPTSGLTADSPVVGNVAHDAGAWIVPPQGDNPVLLAKRHHRHKHKSSKRRRHSSRKAAPAQQTPAQPPMQSTPQR